MVEGKGLLITLDDSKPIIPQIRKNYKKLGGKMSELYKQEMWKWLERFETAHLQKEQNITQVKVAKTKKQPVNEKDKTEFIIFLETHYKKLISAGIEFPNLKKIIQNLKGETI